jgi:NAD-dependent SIR2 family protein deacetylase
MIEEARSACSPHIEKLGAAIQRREVILFVGGGVSQSLGLPDFTALIEYLANDLEFDGNSISLADYPVVAEAYLVKRGKLGHLRSWMDKTWHPASVDISQSAAHNLIVDLSFPIIYTTNYDRWLERAFQARQKPFRKIANVADLSGIKQDETQIIKFHGDFEDDDSLVLTETSYFERMGFETPLDIRLRADCLARPILFIGYSLSDINTRYLLYRLQELWQNSAYAAQRPISYIFMTEASPAQEIVLRRRGVEPITGYDDDPGKGLVAFLRDVVAAAGH